MCPTKASDSNTTIETSMNVSADTLPSLEETRVEFYSNRAINDDDLQMLMLYVENRKASGGGDTIAYSLDDSRRILTVQYENNAAKKRVIDKQVWLILYKHIFKWVK